MINTKCPLCKKHATKDLGKLEFNTPGYDKNSKLLSCYNCGYSYVSPPPNEAKISKIYSKIYHYQKLGIKEYVYSSLLSQPAKKRSQIDNQLHQ